jgi:acid phosphatase
MAHNSLLVITWDEDEDDYTPVKDAAGATVAKQYLNHTVTIMAGEHVLPGVYSERIDHYGLLHTIEDFYGLSPLTDAVARAPVISDAFGGR